jgi:hypothetical protein
MVEVFPDADLIVVQSGRKGIYYNLMAQFVLRPRFVGGSAWRDRTAQPADPVPPARAPQTPDEERSGRQLCQMHN